MPEPAAPAEKPTPRWWRRLVVICIAVAALCFLPVVVAEVQVVHARATCRSVRPGISRAEAQRILTEGEGDLPVFELPAISSIIMTTDPPGPGNDTFVYSGGLLEEWSCYVTYDPSGWVVDTRFSSEPFLGL